MPVPNHSYSVPIFLSGLQTLSYLLTKTADYASANNIPPSNIAGACLPPDKKALSHQIRGAARVAKNAVSYLTDAEIPDIEGPVDTLNDLQAHIAEAIAILERAGGPDAFGKDDISELKFPWEQTQQTATVHKYVTGFALPDFFFHLGNAYAILKAQRVPLSKTDYLHSFIA
ncbi:hypothetical protein SEUCBS139899_008840 [Sporothrix eucalyptigena]|uniref:DUF1993 domain-containing protein n=1 Tax=Sporothrix eucalyptigena TaxID=1812306 RepID=A0ABP0CEX0_9PEZI